MSTLAPRDFARYALIGASVGLGLFVALFALWKLALVWLLLFAGILFGVFLHGLVRRLQAVAPSLPHGAHYGVVVALVLAATAALFVIFVPLFIEGVSILATSLPEAAGRIGEQLQRYPWGRSLLDALQGGDWGAITGRLLPQVAGLFSTALGGLAALFIILFIGLYLAATPGLYADGLVRLLPPSGRPRAIEILAEMRHALEWWLIARIASMAIVGGLTWGGLLLLDFPFAATLALLAGLLNVVPNIGPLLSAVPALLIGTAQSPLLGGAIALLYLFVQTVETYFLTPMIQQRVVELPAAVVLVVEIAFGVLYGFLGLLLATPLTVVAMVLMKMLYVEGVLRESPSLP